ncbi:TIGR03086 family metal-binding protein [Flexivirga meconopsidis]|uniref:TIGR03086 family metal-binding protein n=1 Tax=Flexivirga meconopsidis TaxID=2977121 RepID=UPI002240A2BD|nr:TIGR03086 family metal-binding protein [Flexivirga meconopsidis]
MNTTNVISIIDEAHDALRSAARRLGPADLARPSACADWSVGQVLEHAVLDQVIWAAGIDGGPGPEGDPFAPTGAPATGLSAYVDAALVRARDAWATVDGGAAQVSTPLPQGPQAADVAAAMAALDAAVHAWDITSSLGAPSPLTDGLAAQLDPAARALVEPLRQWGAYAPALAGQDGDDPAARLLRFLGRDPGRTVEARL